jgi:hypothetical protein
MFAHRSRPVYPVTVLLSTVTSLLNALCLCDSTHCDVSYHLQIPQYCPLIMGGLVHTVITSLLPDTLSLFSRVMAVYTVTFQTVYRYLNTDYTT